MKQFRKFNTIAEAELAAGLLDLQGIRCEARHGLYHLNPKTRPSVWLEQEEDFEAAVKILDEPPKPRGPGWSCPACRSENEAQFDACWSCGSPRA